MKRKQGEKEELDRFEEDKQFLHGLTDSYKQLAKNQTFAKWIIINGEQPLEKVTQDIQQEIRSHDWA